MTQIETGQGEDFKAALARAFDAAWEPFIAIEGESADTDDNRRRLAAKIVQLAKLGENDEDVLSQIGLIHLRVMAAGARLSARNEGTARDDAPGIVPHQSDDGQTSGSHAFGPEAVDAMSTALDRCLDALPLHMPADARQLLSTTILDEASRGERDPARLELHALDALKARQ